MLTWGVIYLLVSIVILINLLIEYKIGYLSYEAMDIAMFSSMTVCLIVGTSILLT